MAGATVAVNFEPDPELTVRLNTEREFRFVEAPTAEVQADANEDTTTPTTPSNTGGSTGGNTGGGSDEG